MGAILYETRPPEATDQSHIAVPELAYTKMDPPPGMNGGFLDNIKLSLDPPVKIHNPDPVRARLHLQSDLPAAGFDKLQSRPGDTTKPVLTVVDRELNCELFSSEDFALQLSLKPVYPNPETPIPTRLDPGLGVSIKFQPQSRSSILDSRPWLRPAARALR